MPLLILLLLLLIFSVTLAQSGSSSVEIGNTTFYSFDNFSGSRQSSGTPPSTISATARPDPANPDACNVYKDLNFPPNHPQVIDNAALHARSA